MCFELNRREPVTSRPPYMENDHLSAVSPPRPATRGHKQFVMHAGRKSGREASPGELQHEERRSPIYRALSTTGAAISPTAMLPDCSRGEYLRSLPARILRKTDASVTYSTFQPSTPALYKDDKVQNPRVFTC